MQSKKSKIISIVAFLFTVMYFVVMTYMVTSTFISVSEMANYCFVD